MMARAEIKRREGSGRYLRKDASFWLSVHSAFHSVTCKQNFYWHLDEFLFQILASMSGYKDCGLSEAD